MKIEFFKDDVKSSQTKRGFQYHSGIGWIITGFITENYFYGVEIDIKRR